MAEKTKLELTRIEGARGPSVIFVQREHTRHFAIQLITGEPRLVREAVRLASSRHVDGHFLHEPAAARLQTSVAKLRRSRGIDAVGVGLGRV